MHSNGFYRASRIVIVLTEIHDYYGSHKASLNGVYRVSCIIMVFTELISIRGLHKIHAYSSILMFFTEIHAYS